MRTLYLYILTVVTSLLTSRLIFSVQHVEMMEKRTFALFLSTSKSTLTSSREIIFQFQHTNYTVQSDHKIITEKRAKKLLSSHSSQVCYLLILDGEICTYTVLRMYQNARARDLLYQM